MNAPLRRGACPGLSAPMQTGDGLLVRMLPLGAMSLEAFIALCAAARDHGNGVVEVTARGSIQLRGLNPVSAPRFVDAVAALGIAAADGVAVHINPLAGVDADEILDVEELAADLRRALAERALAATLAPKISVAIDGGDALGLDGLAADVRLRAELKNGHAVLELSVGGDQASAMVLGFVAPADTVEAVTRLLEVIAQHGRSVRARDLVVADGANQFKKAIHGLLLPPARTRDSAAPELDSRLRGNERIPAIGTHRLRDGSLACGVGLAFGHADASSLERLAKAAAAAGARGLRTAPGRVVLAIGIAPESLYVFAAEAERLGFILRADDPRRFVVACAGAPICASAHIAARALAPRVAADCAHFLGVRFTIHVSGCAKGCAHPAPAGLTVVGAAEGCGLVADGVARDPPFATVRADDLPAAIARYTNEMTGEVSHV
jgi:precorrin-3B synthase